jgi:hypothetical protein
MRGAISFPGRDAIRSIASQIRGRHETRLAKVPDALQRVRDTSPCIFACNHVALRPLARHG